MKLLIYSHFFAPSVGGVETIVLSLARGLSDLRNSTGAHGFEITLVTQTPAGVFNDDSLPFRVVRQPHFFQLWKLIGEADKISLAGPAILPLLFSQLRRKNTVVTHHGYQAICPNGMLFQFSPQTDCPGHYAAGRYGECLRCNAPQEGWAGSLKLLLLTFLRRALAVRASANVGPSEHVTSRIALPRSHVIRNATIDTGDPTVVMRPAGNPQSEARFAYFGRLVTEKGVKILLEAAGLLAQRGFTPTILIIGDGPERLALELQKTVLNLGENVAFLGFQSGSALEEKIRNVSVLVMPSLCQDVAPLSALEMMMRGRLVIASKIGGLAEIVENTGLTFPAGDAHALAEAMKSVLQNPSIIETLGSKARERALRLFRRERMIEAHARLYERATAPNKN